MPPPLLPPYITLRLHNGNESIPCACKLLSWKPSRVIALQIGHHLPRLRLAPHQATATSHISVNTARVAWNESDVGWDTDGLDVLDERDRALVLADRPEAGELARSDDVGVDELKKGEDALLVELSVLRAIACVESVDGLQADRLLLVVVEHNVCVVGTSS